MLSKFLHPRMIAQALIEMAARASLAEAGLRGQINSPLGDRAQHNNEPANASALCA